VPVVLVSTDSGLRIYSESGEQPTELAGRKVGGLAREADAFLIAIVDEREIWRRSKSGAWSLVAIADIALQSLTNLRGTVYAGGMNEAAIVRVMPDGRTERLQSFDRMDGRKEWFAGGPPLGIRSMAATSDGAVLLAGVHVGGIPISEDQGKSWKPTMPVKFDVHEVRSHPSRKNLVAAVAAVGLCISEDAGRTWRVFSKELEENGFEVRTSLAVAVLEDEVLFSVQESPFATRSQIWSWHIGESRVEQAWDGLPEWLSGKVDTGGMAVGDGKVAIVDCGGNLWLRPYRSERLSGGTPAHGTTAWEKIAEGLPYAWGVAIVGD
jgi:hypothetical protein